MYANGSLFTPWSKCADVPANFVMQRISVTSPFQASYSWRDSNVGFHQVFEDLDGDLEIEATDGYNATMGAFLTLGGDGSPNGCRAVFWFGLIHTAKSIDPDGDFLTTPLPEAAGTLGIRPIWSVGNSVAYGDNGIPPDVTTYNLTEGPLELSFKCGNGFVFWNTTTAIDPWVGINYLTQVYDGNLALFYDNRDHEGWNEVIPEDIWDAEPLLIYLPVCWGQDSRQIVFTAIP